MPLAAPRAGRATSRVPRGDVPRDSGADESVDASDDSTNTRPCRPALGRLVPGARKPAASSARRRGAHRPSVRIVVVATSAPAGTSMPGPTRIARGAERVAQGVVRSASGNRAGRPSYSPAIRRLSTSLSGRGLARLCAFIVPDEEADHFACPHGRARPSSVRREKLGLDALDSALSLSPQTSAATIPSSRLVPSSCRTPLACLPLIVPPAPAIPRQLGGVTGKAGPSPLCACARARRSAQFAI